MKKNLGMKSIKLIRKYQISLIVSAFIFAGVIFAVNIKMHEVEQKIMRLTEEDAKVQQIAELQKKYLEMNVIVSEFVSFGETKTVDLYNQLFEEIKKEQQSLLATLLDEESKRKIELTIGRTDMLKSIFDEEIVFGVARNLRGMFIPARKEYVTINTEIISMYDQIIEKFNKDKESANTNLYSILKETSVIVIVLILGAITVAFVWIYILTSNVSKKLKGLVKVNQDISDKRLNVPKINITSRDEIGLLSESVNTMLDTLKAIVLEMGEVSGKLNQKGENLNHSTHQVRSNSNEINETMEQLTSAVNDQAEDLNKILHNIELLTLQVIDANSQSRELSRASKELNSISNRGNASMEKSMHIMNSIQSIVNDSVQKIGKLEEHSKGISSLTNVISSISEQTNLLALNASIEAARAGEAGRGFAVVAGEIGNLAKQVKLSVSDIESITKAIQDETKTVALALNKSYQEVEEGTKQIRRTGEEFVEINKEAYNIETKALTIDKNLDVIEESTKSVNESLERISAISEETSASVEQTLAAVLTQDTSIEEISDSSKELRVLADELSQMISGFTI
jgi:methyl-accepting chemotaxis protein